MNVGELKKKLDELALDDRSEVYLSSPRADDWQLSEVQADDDGDVILS